MRQLTSSLLLAVVLMLSPASVSCKRLTPDSLEEGQWQVLFNGRNLDGWSVKCKPEDAGKNFWRAEEGAILADSMSYEGHDYVWLVTEREFTDFILQLKFQAFRESPGNSGVQIRSRYDDSEGWLDGPQVDIHPAGFWRCGMMWDETRGVRRWIFPDLTADQWVDESMSVPPRVFYFSDNEPSWNDLQIQAEGLQVSTVLNGVQITDFNGRGILDDDLHRRWNVGERGHIALQIHSGDQLKIRFRDIRIQELD